MRTPVSEPDPARSDAIRALGFDPALVQSVIITPTSAVGISIDYPEPYVAPQEAPDASS